MHSTIAKPVPIGSTSSVPCAFAAPACRRSVLQQAGRVRHRAMISTTAARFYGAKHRYRIAIGPAQGLDMEDGIAKTSSLNRRAFAAA